MKDTYCNIFNSGKKFIEASLRLKPIEKIETFDEEIDFVCFYLMSHGLELQLKSYIYFEMFNDKKNQYLKLEDLEKLIEDKLSSFNHDIEEIYEYAFFKEGLSELVGYNLNHSELEKIIKYYKNKDVKSMLSESDSVVLYKKLHDLIIEISKTLEILYR